MSANKTVPSVDRRAANKTEQNRKERCAMKRILALTLGLMMLLSLAATAAAESGLHIADNITLRFWYPLSISSDVPGMKDYNDSDAYAWLEKQTGVHIEWIHPAKGTEKESFTLLFASDNPPDLIYNDGRYFYPSGPDGAIADGVYVNLSDYEELMPNYMRIINSSKDLQRQTVTDDGNRWCFNYLYQGQRNPDFGPVIRQDFLDKVGMERPVTYDDWHAVLTAFKEQLGIEIPLYLINDTFTRYNEFAAGFGITKDWSLATDGKTVIYGPYEDGFGEYLDMMKQWYAEGLIDQSFSIRTNAWPDDDLVLNDKVGAWCDNTSRLGNTYYPLRGATNPDFNLAGTRIPIKEGGEAHYRCPQTIIGNMQIAISASSTHIEDAIRWMDAQYSEEAAFVMNYGVVEGKDGSYYIDETGPHWGTLLTANPDGLTNSQAKKRYVTTNAPYEDYSRSEGSMTDIQREGVALMLETDANGVIPTCITMSEAEQEEFSDIMSDIITYEEEFAVKYVMGSTAQTFDEFRAQLKAMGIERAIELKQASVDRYNAR